VTFNSSKQKVIEGETKNSLIRMPRLRQNERERAVGMVQAGMRHEDVANQFGCSKLTITRLMSRVRQTGGTADRPRSGRPRVTSERQDRHIRLIHLRNRFIPATITAAQTPGRHNPRISPQTVRNRLREANLRARRPLTGAMLTARHRRERLRWANARLHWNRIRWQHVIFSDESRFLLRRSDGRTRVYRRPNERFADACVHECDRFGGGGVMVWAGITHCGRTELKIVEGRLTGLRYRDEILQPIVQPFIARHGNRHTFQQDNARCHVAHVCMNFIQQQNIDVLPWPALSPDLSPIEHLWDNLDRRLRRRNPQPESLAQVRAALLEEWNNIPQAEIQHLIASMRRRLTAVIDARGGHTRY